MKEDLFQVTDQHIKLSKRLYFSYDDYCEFGAPEVNPKRPYGNSNVYYDIGEILDIEPAEGDEEDPYFSEDQEDLMLKLHKEMKTVLQIGVVTGSFQEGIYLCDSYKNNWEKT